jgi:hypothetical protein
MLRETRANQFGLLGFGADRGDGCKLKGAGSVAMFLIDRRALGGEYRQKPNNLSAFREGDAHDIFMSWFTTKNFALTGPGSRDHRNPPESKGLLPRLAGELIRLSFSSRRTGSP